jgi:exodeoxyribonuclease-3
LISADVGGVRILSAYFPNGGEVGSDKWAYKLAWMRGLASHLRERYDPKQPLALCGDFNVAPEERDVHDPSAWEDTVLFHPDARRGLEQLRGFGLVDSFRLHNQGGGLFSWWDYRRLAFPRNQGLRIDHIFVTEPLARLCVAASIDREQRKGTQPSDHAPVLAEFGL